jgi:hypothetical protein
MDHGSGTDSEILALGSAPYWRPLSVADVQGARDWRDLLVRCSGAAQIHQAGREAADPHRPKRDLPIRGCRLHGRSRTCTPARSRRMPRSWVASISCGPSRSAADAGDWRDPVASLSCAKSPFIALPLPPIDTARSARCSVVAGPGQDGVCDVGQPAWGRFPWLTSCRTVHKSGWTDASGDAEATAETSRPPRSKS